MNRLVVFVFPTIFVLISLVVWMSLFLRNAYSTLRNSWRAVKSAKPWKNFSHSGICLSNASGKFFHIWCTFWIVLTVLWTFYFYSGDLVQIMMATANENLSAKFCNRVLKFFTKLFQLSKFNLLVFLHIFLLSYNCYSNLSQTCLNFQLRRVQTPASCVCVDLWPS